MSFIISSALVWKIKLCAVVGGRFGVLPLAILVWVLKITPWGLAPIVMHSSSEMLLILNDI